jgi:probable phosphoglycerate mutase
VSTTRVLLVRHGQSEWNALGRWQGQADPPLSDLGRAQARAASASLGALDAIWASDLQRAAETATIIAAELGIGPVVLDPDLRERDAGEWAGLTRAEIDERYPGYLDPPPADKHTSFGAAPATTTPRRPPGWEPDDSVLERARRALHRIAAAVGDGLVLVVTHGGLIYSLERDLGADFARLANAEGRWFEVDAGPGAAVRLGDRVMLAGPDDVPVTTPGQL